MNLLAVFMLAGIRLYRRERELSFGILEFTNENVVRQYSIDSRWMPGISPKNSRIGGIPKRTARRGDTVAR